MDSNQKTIVELLSLSLRGAKASHELMDRADWSSIIRLSQIHSVLPLVYTSMNIEWADKNIFADFRLNAYKQAMQQVRDLKVIENIFDEFNKAGIPSIAMKGLVLRSLYPVPETRTMSDYDIAVKDEDLESAIRVLLKLGFKVAGYERIIHVQLVNSDDMLIELHRQVFDEDQNDLQRDFMNELWRNAVPVSVCGRSVLTFSDNDTILYLCLHLAKHYKEGGFGIRQLCDIVVFVEAKGSQINWEQFYFQTVRYQISRFTLVVFTLCNKLLNMDIPEYLVPRIVPEDERLELLIQDIFEGGTFGMNDAIRDAGNKVINKVGFKERGSLGRLSGYIRFIFPMPGRMGEKYFYIKRYPVLLPVAWIHRWVYNLINRDQRRIMNAFFRKGSAQTSFDVMRNRRELVSWLMNEGQPENQEIKGGQSKNN